MSTLKIKRENGKIFCPLADSWHIETPEEKVRQEYIKILVENYGYSLDQMAQEIKVNNSQRGQGKARADIVIWKSKQDKIESKAAFIVVECKAENVRIREEDYLCQLFLFLRAVEHTVHGVCRSLLCRVVEMCIDVCRGGEGAVTQPDLDLLHGDTVAEKQAGAGVTKIMEANLAKPVLLDEPREMLRYIVRA